VKRKAKPKSKIDLDAMSLPDLLVLQNNVQKAIAHKRDSEANELKKKWAAEAKSLGLSFGDLVGSGKGGRGAGKAKSLGIAKFANPENASDTWTGRGRKPNWLVDRLKKGAKLNDFAI
jgi:DNA-binding protein H-NS